MKTQEQKVKERLKEVGYADNFWAISNYILRLGAIMCQLKKQGWEFKGEFGTGKDRKNYFYRAEKTGIAENEAIISGKRVAVWKERKVEDKNDTLFAQKP
jgi:hypothetical protein